MEPRERCPEKFLEPLLLRNSNSLQVEAGQDCYWSNVLKHNKVVKIVK